MISPLPHCAMPIFAGLLSFVVVFLALRHGWTDGILFYQGIISAVVGGGATMCINLRQRRTTPLQNAKDALLVLLACYAFMFTIPTTVERSYSVKLLEELDSRGSMTDAEALSWIEAHWAGKQGLAKRLQEQELSGSIRRADGRISLTSRGQMLVRSFKLTATWFAASGEE